MCVCMYVYIYIYIYTPINKAVLPEGAKAGLTADLGRGQTGSTLMGREFTKGGLVKGG